MAARIRKIRHDDETRAKIQAAMIIHRFQQCLNGEITLDAQQVSVGKTLLNKVLPDLQSATIEGNEDDGSLGVVIYTGVPRSDASSD